MTVILLLLFIGGWIWAWSPRRKRDFDEAARLPLADDEDPPADRRADNGVPPADHAADGIQNGKDNGESAR
ncbi:cbb3-type cytochrome c oxidase subunit 3 [Luteimonas sp. YGD11-2]|uniref:cbb3-type cytochrome oxidase subunit 3 n=1 Tax=Luteimonas sp. YGD11-2 TaxID=2508168 RepID=UPI001F51009B|nr:cbb3-type cytochrome c oxidase subunit 3 [Luteimonas sp. YGD11-2]